MPCKTRILTLRLSDKQYKDLDIFSKQNNKRRSVVARKSIISFIKKQKGVL